MRYITFFILLCGVALGQESRYDPTPVLTYATIGGLPNIVQIVPGAQIRVCQYTVSPAIPCTPQIQTFTDYTGSTPCALSTQVVLAGTNTCTATADSSGNFGFWAPPGPLIYQISGSGVQTKTFFVNGICVPVTLSNCGAQTGTPNTWTATQTFSQPIVSTVTTGTAPLAIASTTVIPNLNASLLLGNTWAAPGAIGGTTASTANFTQATLNSGALATPEFPSVHGVNTAGSTGTSIVRAYIQPLGNTANITSTTLYTTPASATVLPGPYRVSCYIVVQQAAGTSSTLPSCVIGWTDNYPLGTPTLSNTVTTTNSGNTAGTYQQGTIIIHSNSSSNITYSTTGYASNPASTMTYGVMIVLEQL
jgi:hypothetical protein